MKKALAIGAAIVVAAAVTTIVIVRSRRTPPDVRVEVLFEAEGSDVDRTERAVTRPAERVAATSIPNVTTIDSVTVAGRARLTVSFPPATDPLQATSVVSAAMQPLLRQLPPGVAPPLVSLPRAEPTAYAVVTSNAHDRVALRTLTRRLVVEPLTKTAGVRTIDICGGRDPRVRVSVDAPRAQAFGVTVADVVAAVRAASPHDLASLGDVTVKGGRLRDVAGVERTGVASPCEGAVGGVGAIVVELATADAAAANAAHERVLAAAKEVPPGARVEWVGPSIAVRFAEPTLAGDSTRKVIEELARRVNALYTETRRAPDDLREPNVVLVPAGNDARAAARATAEVLARHGLRFDATWPEGRIAETTVSLSGPDADALAKAASELVSALGRVPGVVGPAAIGAERVPERTVDVDAQAAARYGVEASVVAETLRAAASTVPAGVLDEAGELVPIEVEWSEHDVTRVTVATRASGFVPLGQVARIQSQLMPVRIVHVGMACAVLVRFTEWPKADRAAIQAAIAAVHLPPGSSATLQ